MQHHFVLSSTDRRARLIQLAAAGDTEANAQLVRWSHRYGAARHAMALRDAIKQQAPIVLQQGERRGSPYQILPWLTNAALSVRSPLRSDLCWHGTTQRRWLLACVEAQRPLFETLFPSSDNLTAVCYRLTQAHTWYHDARERRILYQCTQPFLERLKRRAQTRYAAAPRERWVALLLSEVLEKLCHPRTIDAPGAVSTMLIEAHSSWDVAFVARATRCPKVLGEVEEIARDAMTEVHVALLLDMVLGS